MLVFDYHCNACDRVFEEIVDSRDDAVSCPACASADTTRKVSGFALGRVEGGGAADHAGLGSGGGGFGGGCANGMCGI